MNDDLTTEERAKAHSENWDVYYVWDLAKRRWFRSVLPLVFNREVTAERALAHVIASARHNSALHIKALRLVTHFKAH